MPRSFSSQLCHRSGSRLAPHFGVSLGLTVLIAVAASFTAPEACAQQVTIGVPQQNISTGFYEQIGGSWSVNGPGFFARFGGPRPVQFGGFDPNAGISTGIGIGTGNRFGQFHFNAAQGSRTTFTSTTPMLTVTNGIPGSMFIGSVRPYVTGFVPVGNGSFVPQVQTFPSTPSFQNFQNFGSANSIDARMQRGEFHVRDGNVVPGPVNPAHAPPDPALQHLPGLLGPQRLPELPPAVPPPGKAQFVIDADANSATADFNGPTVTAVQERARELFQKGRQLAAEGYPGAARLLYQTALRTADTALQKEIATEIQSLPE